MALTKQSIATNRSLVAYYRTSNQQLPKLVLVHGNVSSSEFFLPLMERLQEYFDVIAFDLRGFGDSEATPIDARLGMRNWSEDLHALMAALQIDSFSLAGWSLGGGIVMQYAIDYSEQLEKLILLSPLSPFGFGGTFGEDGQMISKEGHGSGGYNQAFVEALRVQDHSEDNPNGPRSVLLRTYFKPPFRVAKEYEDVLVESMLKTKLGEEYYPGNILPSTSWPMMVPGDKGINNTMAPQYCNLSALAKIPFRPDILWLRSDSDVMVSDSSFADLANLGKLGFLPGYPGEQVFPIQPMVGQTRYVLHQYQEGGGRVEEVLVENAGHACHIEQEDIVVATILQFFAR